jgi:hypothetical protein
MAADNNNNERTNEMTSTDYWTSTAAAAAAAPAAAAHAATTPAAPRIRLSQIEREEKSSQHKFGICCSCDAGLDDRADFAITVVADGIKVRCNDCECYYQVEESIDTMFGSCYDEWSF